MRIAVLVSGSGTILDAMLGDGLPIQLVLADRPCGGLGIAERAGIAVEVVQRDSYGPDIDLVVMAGFGTVFSQPMHDQFGGRMLNTHPALLPAFPGWHAVRDALASGVKVTGTTVHVAGLAVDTGPILAQEAVPVLDDDTEDTLHERIKQVERRLYPATIRAILDRGRVLP